MKHIVLSPIDDSARRLIRTLLDEAIMERRLDSYAVLVDGTIALRATAQRRKLVAPLQALGLVEVELS